MPEATSKKSTNWCVIGDQLSQARYTYLSQFLQNEIQIENKFEFKNTNVSNFEKNIFEAKAKFDNIIIGSLFSNHVLKYLEQIPALLIPVQSVDWLKKEKYNWWAECITQEAIISVLAHKQISLDFTGSALLVGNTYEMRPFVAAFAKLGIKSITLCTKEDQENEIKKLNDDLKKVFFSFKVNQIKPNLLATLPASYSIVVNTFEHAENTEIFEYLYYFNFLKPGGLVVDFSYTSAESNLAKETVSIGAPLIFGYEIFTRIDTLWIEKAFQKDIDYDKYLVGLKKSLFG